jgi:hypothetical protein
MPKKNSNKKNSNKKNSNNSKPPIMPDTSIPHASLQVNKGVAPRIPLLN